MERGKPEFLEDSEAELDLRRYPAEQVRFLLDLVQFDCFLEYVYAVLFKRMPDRDGQTHYRELSKHGLPRPAIVRRLVRSQEHRLTSVWAAGLTADDFINQAYQDILGRWPDQNGLEIYRRIAVKLNGRKRVIENLRRSDEAIRKGGGRLARIEALYAYDKASWPSRLPVVGQWFRRYRRAQQRIEQIALNQYLLARQIVNLRQDLEVSGSMEAQPFGFIATSHGNADKIFQESLIRARREP